MGRNSRYEGFPDEKEFLVGRNSRCEGFPDGKEFQCEGFPGELRNSRWEGFQVGRIPWWKGISRVKGF